jgi:4-amino-4-deoxy-L-arabinose transferase-like glycosyltransferase
MQEKQEKAVMTGLAILGCLLTGYGMIEKNNVVFVIGLLGVVAAYLMFRRRWKEAIKRKDEVRSQKSEFRR